jgi:hypothetical protein
MIRNALLSLLARGDERHHAAPDPATDTGTATIWRRSAGSEGTTRERYCADKLSPLVGQSDCGIGQRHGACDPVETGR